MDTSEQEGAMLNVPWIFAYMTDSRSLVFQHVKDNPELVEAIEAHVPDAEVQDGQIRPKKADSLRWICVL